MAADSRHSGRLAILFVTAIVIAAAIFFTVRAPAIKVDVGEVSRGPMATTIDDEGEATVHDVFVVSAPLDGRLLRIELEAGDRVDRNRTVIARIVPAEPAFLDTRSRAAAQAQEKAFSAQLASSQARVRQAQAERALADRDLARVQELAGQGFSTLASLDAARMRHDRAEAALAEARSAVATASHQLTAARAALISPSSDDGVPASGVAVTAPVSGTVLRVRQKSETLVGSGAPLVEIGDPEKMEIVTDFLSSDAVRIAVGADVDIDKWGGNQPLHGKVRRIDPSGFMKVSALGVEEQRVNVHVDITDPYPVWKRLGHGYRVITKVRTWDSPDALRVPLPALFRRQNRWAVFVMKDGRAHLTPVEVGHLSDEAAEVLKGLDPGDQVILHPGDTIRDRSKVRARPAS